ncbi:hypothetical protein D9756_000061 [Leucocoprinus leucothites]|uniref:Protein kinase domain-containing protein n=1 Tax=Leucocoprinus leucothites TaxID=201217 RepID=A0A8H5LNP4_9AGAR|nr:hypothetical protein D9756_000061 [Leucoagaricus leucothites]
MSLLRSFFHRRPITTSLFYPEHGMSSSSRPPVTLTGMQLKWRPPADLLGSSSSAHSSCFASPTLDSVSEGEETAVDYFGRQSRHSPGLTDYTSDAESDGAESDVTPEDAAEIFADFGHPLERIPRLADRDGELDLDSVQEFGHGAVYHPGTTFSSWCPSPAPSISSVTSSLTDYPAIIDDLLSLPQNPFDELDPQNFVTFDPNPVASLSAIPSEPALMIKRISRDSTELSILSDLNSADLRQDPWNPCPHILQVVDHDPTSNHLYLCMERLSEFNAPPMSTVAQYLDFFRQILEGLSFLHERDLYGFACSDPNSYMVDLSSGLHSNNGSSVSLCPAGTTSRGRRQDPSTPHKTSGRRDHPHHHSQHQKHGPFQPADVTIFDRSAYPVRYYFVNFINAGRLQEGEPARDRTGCVPLSSSPSPSRRSCPFKRDVKELGAMMERMFADVPSVVSMKFRALIKAMTTGGFGAEDSRKLFEALSQSLEAGVFEMTVRRGSGLRSWSVVPSESGAMSGSTYTRSGARGNFGLDPDTVGLSS